MGQIFLFLLILAQPLTFLVDSVDTQFRVCGFDRVGCVKLSDGFCFLVNEKVVEEKELVCKYLDLYLANECLFGGEVCENFAKKYCDWEINGRNASSTYQQTSRKLLNHVSTNKLSPDISSKNDSHEKRLLSPRKVAMAIPVTFLLCCALMCPCFRAKKKQPDDQNIRSTDILIESVSSISMPSPARNAPGTPRRVPPSPHRVPPSPSRFSSSQQSAVGSMQLSVNQIVKATQNFSDSFKIGEGGFGFIYKAVLPDGRIVSVKRAKKDHFVREEFNNEVELLTKIDHMNLVRLLGYTDKGNERIIITEYVSNGTLREHLDGQHGKILDFNQRLQIAIDVAHALTYLHLYAEKPIIHRDVKSSNIMITENYRAKVSDFGFARVGPTEAEQTHILTQVKGTAGYLDPEYLKTFKLTPKSDVFSYGILLIEILSARRPVEMKRSVDTRITVRWAFKNFTDGNVMAILDPLLNESVDGKIAMKMLSLAFECAAPTRADRPDMREVVEQLWEIRKQYDKRGARST